MENLLSRTNADVSLGGAWIGKALLFIVRGISIPKLQRLEANSIKVSSECFFSRNSSSDIFYFSHVEGTMHREQICSTGK